MNVISWTWQRTNAVKVNLRIKCNRMLLKKDEWFQFISVELINKKNQNHCWNVTKNIYWSTNSFKYFSASFFFYFILLLDHISEAFFHYICQTALVKNDFSGYIFYIFPVQWKPRISRFVGFECLQYRMRKSFFLRKFLVLNYINYLKTVLDELNMHCHKSGCFLSSWKVDF